MERAERFILLGLCFIAGSVSAAAFVPALWVFFGLLSATALGRFVDVWKEAEGPVRPLSAPAAPVRPPTASTGRSPAGAKAAWTPAGGCGARRGPSATGSEAAGRRGTVGRRRPRGVGARGVPGYPRAAPDGSGGPGGPSARPRVPGAVRRRAASDRAAPADQCPTRPPPVVPVPGPPIWPTGRSVRPCSGCPSPWRCPPPRSWRWPWRRSAARPGPCTSAICDACSARA